MSNSQPYHLPKISEMYNYYPGVIALMGIPGAGKSAIVSELKRCFPEFRVVSRDIIRKAMFDPCSYSEKEKSAAFDALLTAVEILVAQGNTVLTDGMCLSNAKDVGELRRVVEVSGGILLPVFVGCDIDLAKARVQQDHETGRHPAADRTPDLVEQVARRFQPIPNDAIIVQGGAPVSESAALVIFSWQDVNRQK